MASRMLKLAFLSLVSLQSVTVAEAAISIANVSPSGGQVLVDHDGIYMRATRLQDGTILGGYAAQQGDNKVLRVVKSRDNGSSWAIIGTVSSGESTTHELDNALPVQLPGGRILFAFRNHDRARNGDFTYYRITVCYSDDDGDWSRSTVTGGAGSHWAGLLSLSSTEFLALYAQNGHGLVSQKYLA